MPTVRSKQPLVMVCVVVGLGVMSGAINYAGEEETLAGDPSKFEQEFGCPEDYPIIVPVMTKEDVATDANGDKIICGNGNKEFVDNNVAPDDDGRLMANGHGNFFDGGKVKMQDISFSFHGIERGDDGAAKGQFEYHDQTPDGRDLAVHGDVMCLAVSPKVNIATFIGRVTQSNDLGLLVGDVVGWQAQDNGEGDLTFNPDRVSRLFVLKVLKFTCKEQFKPTPLVRIENGNVQVHY